MSKLLALTILLASSPASGLLKELFNSEKQCYLGCQSNSASNGAYLEACQRGCNYKLYNEDCTSQCNTWYFDEQSQKSCQQGCTLSSSAAQPASTVEKSEPILAVDPVPTPEGPQEPSVVAESQEPEQPRSIILIRLRQPSVMELPSFGRMFGNDPFQFMNDMLRQFREKAKEMNQWIEQSPVQSPDMQKAPEFGPVFRLANSIPIVRLPNNFRADSSSESSEEHKESGHGPLVDKSGLFLQRPREQQYPEQPHPLKARVHQFFEDIRSEWNDLVRKQPKVPIWIFLCILLLSSAILWYMVMSLCRHTPSHESLSIRAQELVFHPYEYESYEKEKIQPDDQPYQVTESLPIKVKLSNI